jgi:hypothetical protein
MIQIDAAINFMTKIKHKITTGIAMLAQADKSNTTVITYKHNYFENVHTFLTENDIHLTSKIH